jgi:hypothetical protein
MKLKTQLLSALVVVTTLYASAATTPGNSKSTAHVQEAAQKYSNSQAVYSVIYLPVLGTVVLEQVQGSGLKMVVPTNGIIGHQDSQ